MPFTPTRCAYCKRYLDKNGEPDCNGYKITNARWYKVKHGYTHRGCYDLQVKKEISEPLFVAPPILRLVPP